MLQGLLPINVSVPGLHRRLPEAVGTAPKSGRKRVIPSGGRELDPREVPVLAGSGSCSCPRTPFVPRRAGLGGAGPPFIPRILLCWPWCVAVVWALVRA
jgi:hypothetical protein